MNIFQHITKLFLGVSHAFIKRRQSNSVYLTYNEIVERAYEGYFCRWEPGKVDPTWRRNNIV